MRKLLAKAAVIGLLGTFVGVANADPAADKDAFQNYFKEKFPKVELNEFQNGVYAIDPASREQWEEIEEFPPYEIAIEEGERIYNTAFANGKTFADCLPNGGIGVAQTYPRFDEEKGQVVTLALAVNNCLKANGEKPLKYKKGKMASLLAYLAYTSRGKVFDIKVDSDAAKAAYEKGKHFYYARRGQLNMACAHCHVDNAGKYIRADILSPALGHATHFPVYRSKWGSMGTLHRRFGGCNKQVRAKPFKAQSEEYRNLEYFLSYMSNGIEANGPGARK
jgi:sulfur-oxidizing protein SoxA